MWYGLKPDGSQVAIGHDKLMDWARENDRQFDIGWADHVVMRDGTRLARTREAALAQGWEDIAKAPF